MNKLSRCTSGIIVNMLLSLTITAANPVTNNDTVFEISDKYNQVFLGITETSVYMIVSDEVRELANEGISQVNKINKSYFNDSQGKFIGSDHSYLTSNKIEYDFNDIAAVKFMNGKLSFSYNSKRDIAFEDILSFNGIRALDNFYVEDIEKFIIYFESYK